MKQLIRTMKKNRLFSTVLALTLTLALVLSTVMGLPVMANESNVWTGGTSQPAEGDGSEATPWLITNADELAWVMQEGGSGVYAELTADIYLNNLSTVDWATGTVNDSTALKSWTSAAFDGTIDGNGHIIYGLYAVKYNGSYWSQASTTWSTGFIGEITATGSVTIKNLGFDNFFVNASCNGSVMVAQAAKGAKLTVENSFVGANGKLAANYGAPFVAYAQGTTNATDYNITNCYSLLTNYECAGTYSFVGGSWGTFNIKNCYSLGKMHYNGSYTNCYSADETDVADGITVLTTTEMQGATAAEKMPLGDAYAYTATYPALKVFPHEAIDLPEDLPVDDNVWSGTTAAPTNGGDGSTEATAILIDNAEQLAHVMQNGGNGNFYKLTADIYLNQVEYINWTDGTVQEGYDIRPWTAAAFNGTIDGDGHVIYGLYNISKATADGHWDDFNYKAGFISEIAADASVTIKNLGFDNYYLYSTCVAGVMVGQGDETSTLTIDSSYVGANGKVCGRYQGAFVAYAKGVSNYNITNCYSFLANVVAEYQAGFTGGSWGTINIENCYSVGKMKGNTGAYTNCYSTDSTDIDAGISNLDAADMRGPDAIDRSMPALRSAFYATLSYPVLKSFNTHFLDVVGAQTSGNNIRFVMSYTGEQLDNNTVITIAGERLTIVARGMLVTGADNYSAQFVAGSPSAGVAEVVTEDLTDNWTFNAESGTTEFSVNIDGFDTSDDYEISAVGYVELSNGVICYTDVFTTSVSALS